MGKYQTLFRLTALSLLLFAISAQAQRAYKVDIIRDTFRFNSSSKKSVSLEDLHQGCSARDCIPSIDNPKFVAAADAAHVGDNDVVIAISFGGEQRAYPARILDRHEIVNDTIADTPLAITYCPLCGSAVGVRRELGGIVTEFGVSGLLYNSALVFYDRETETLWDQVEARGIVGPLTGETLEMVPVTMTRWSRWRAAHPDTLVLSTDTGFALDYTNDAYAAYRGTSRLMFPVNRRSKKLSPKTVVYGFEIDDDSIAYTEDLLEKQQSYTHEIKGEPATVTMQNDGSVVLELSDSGVQHTPIRLFWFAWYTFHPETSLIQ